jgi:hypothetical protein
MFIPVGLVNENYVLLSKSLVEYGYLRDLITGTAIMTHITTLCAAVWRIVWHISKPTYYRIPPAQLPSSVLHIPFSHPLLLRPCSGSLQNGWIAAGIWLYFEVPGVNGLDVLAVCPTIGLQREHLWNEISGLLPQLENESDRMATWNVVYLKSSASTRTRRQVYDVLIVFEGCNNTTCCTGRLNFSLLSVFRGFGK